MTFPLHRHIVLQHWRLSRNIALATGLVRSIFTRGVGGTILSIRRRVQPLADTALTGPATVHTRSGRLLLFIDAATPTPSRDSGSVRALALLRLCRELGWSVAFMPDNNQLTSESAALLGTLGVELIGTPGQARLDRWLQHNGNQVNAVFLCRHHVARRHLQLVRAFTAAPIIFDTVDLHHVRLQRAAELQNDQALLRIAEQARTEEFALIAASDATTVVSHAELDYLRANGVDTPVSVLSNVHDVAVAERNFADTSGLLFVGGYQHHPNQEAIAWLLTDIMPLLRQQLPGVVLHLVGEIPAQEAQRLRADDVVVHGHVPEVEPYLQHSRINLAPLRSGAGVKGKINQAMSHGLPVVATGIAAEGMFLRHDDNALIADSAEDYAAQVVRLYQDATLWQRLSANGYRNIEDHFSSALARETLQALLPAD
ncbi:glycosyltransferase [Stenotrophomonas sp. PS02298]|uniref:glycosyltransferase n=1 Tax=Stenotrophomonas sp. PS02298 TaxID=2991424 RepID=UPI00249C4177|nr:glycosyltransferase [Stenotrophomonas sp. PS02298]